ncbi:branched-chain amino acid ABC transporter permease LivH, partial [Escherichia coli]|nr:branched-chain amino acid ABC transporter permease LivH [Escherichia coli]
VINPYIGFMAGMKAFTAAVLGGIGSIPGAMIGGLILVLLVMPTGILGRPEVEKV